MDLRRGLVVGLCAVLGAGASFAVGSCGDDDRGGVEVQGGTGTTGTAGTGTAPKYRRHHRHRPGRARARDGSGGRLRPRPDRRAGEGDPRSWTPRSTRATWPRAKKAYAAGRPYYERIEPLVVLFPELDGKIDAREDDFAKKAADPTWTGFHPIERKLWKERRIDARTRDLAAGLVRDSKRLDALMRRAEVTPEVVIPGVAELVDEVEESKITGEEERYSKLDIPTFIANLEGSKAFYETLEPLVEDADEGLASDIDDAFSERSPRSATSRARPMTSSRPSQQEGDQAEHRGTRRAARAGAGDARREVVTELSRRRFLQGAAGGGAAVAAGALGVAALKDDAEASSDGLVEWRGVRQAGIVTPRTDYGFVAAYDVVDDNLPRLLRDLTARIDELTQGWPDRLDDIDNSSLPPSDTGELGYDKRNDGRLTITLGLGASLFDRRFGAAAASARPR